MPELKLLLADREGALVRLLGLVERRGFRLGTITTRSTPTGTQLSLTLASDDRPVDVLLRQVERLHDVLEATLDMHCQPHIAARVIR
ncbi:MAG TPA: ACT domain-containing protein [Woeseiaceae bacterium]|nr:ACT domain-containing protein [Woeseiaceae bacterium]